MGNFIKTLGCEGEAGCWLEKLTPVSTLLRETQRERSEPQPGGGLESLSGQDLSTLKHLGGLSVATCMHVLQSHQWDIRSNFNVTSRSHGTRVREGYLAKKSTLGRSSGDISPTKSLLEWTLRRGKVFKGRGRLRK